MFRALSAATFAVFIAAGASAQVAVGGQVPPGQPPGGLQAAGASQSESLCVCHRVFRSRLAPGQSHYPIHLVPVAI